MVDWLIASYPWIKVLHLLAVFSWMAGLFYLPRIFVYHVEQAGPGSETDAIFQTMERKLFRLIMNPAMIAAWIFGGLLVATPGVVDWTAAWPYLKGSAIVGMTWFHHWLGLRRKEFVVATNIRSGRHYRLMNEVPTLLLVVIVVAVIAKPF